METARNGSRNLCHLNAVCQPGSEQITLMIDEYLRFIFKAAKCTGMNNAVTITLKLTPPLWCRFKKPSTLRITCVNRVGHVGLKHVHRPLASAAIALAAPHQRQLHGQSP